MNEMEMQSLSKNDSDELLIKKINDNFYLIKGHDHGANKGQAVKISSVEVDSGVDFKDQSIQKLGYIEFSNRNAEEVLKGAISMIEGNFYLSTPTGKKLKLTDGDKLNIKAVGAIKGDYDNGSNNAEVFYNEESDTYYFKGLNNVGAKLRAKFLQCERIECDELTVKNSIGFMPLGSIISVANNIFGAMTIPESGTVNEYGWMLCDVAKIPAGMKLAGNTPNLTNRFLMGSTTAGVSAGVNEIVLKADHIPHHTHEHSHQSKTVNELLTDSGTHFHYAYRVIRPPIQPPSVGDHVGLLATSEIAISTAGCFKIPNGEHDHISQSTSTEYTDSEKKKVGAPISILPPHFSVVYIIRVN